MSCARSLCLIFPLLFFLSRSQIIPDSTSKTIFSSGLGIPNCLRLREVFREILQCVRSVLSILPLHWPHTPQTRGLDRPFCTAAVPSVHVLVKSGGRVLAEMTNKKEQDKNLQVKVSQAYSY